MESKPISERELLHRLLDGAERESDQPQGLYFSIEIDGDCVFTVPDEKIVQVFRSIAEEEFAEALGEPSAWLLLRVLVKFGAVFPAATRLQGLEARTMRHFFGRSSDDVPARLPDLAEDLDASERDLDVALERLGNLGLISPRGDGFILKERFRLRLPEALARFFTSSPRPAPASDSKEH